MEFESIVFTRHAVQQMFSRKISKDEVKDVIKAGEVIQAYPDDLPYPSYLILHYIKQRPLHVVAAKDTKTQTITVITAYEPAPELWDHSFKNRK